MPAMQGADEVYMKVQARISNTNVANKSGGLFTDGMQFVDLDPAHYILLQNLTYEALLEARQKIV